jgi:hypothetical protein
MSTRQTLIGWATEAKVVVSPIHSFVRPHAGLFVANLGNAAVFTPIRDLFHHKLPDQHLL